MEENQMTLEQLEKLEKNPHYKLSPKQEAMLAKYRSENKFINNPNFAKHSTKLKEANGVKSDSN